MADQPRLLTDEEIADILSVMPDIRSAADTVSEHNTKSAKVLVREQLKEIKITPLGISDLKAEIVRQFGESQARAGTMVGITASEALGKNITQAALNSFHTSGSSKNVSTGVDRITELINATKEPKKPSCSIYFRDQDLSFTDVITQKRPEITEITVKDLVLGVPDIENTESIEEPDWYDMYRIFVRDDFKAKDVLRLQLDVNLLYAYRITMEEICQKIEKGQPVVCVYSPISVGQIDIYPVEKLIVSKLKDMKVEYVSTENAGLIFLSMIVIPALDKLKVSGISGIKQIFPVEAGVWQIVKDEQRFEKGWFLILNTVRMRMTGITVEKLTKFCEVLGMNVLKVRENYIAVESETSPTKKVSEALEQDRQREKEYRKQHGQVPPPSEISRASKLIYADSTGANLKELLGHPDIDSTRTYSNNMHEIQETLGVEAGRSFLIKELIDVVSSESYINPRHIEMLADFMCSLGKINGVTSTGISRQPIGALEKASNDKAMKHLKEAAVFGETKEVGGTSASIYIGKQALVGTGYSDSYIPPENLKRYEETRQQLNSDPDMTLDINAFNDVIEQINLETGADVAFLSGAMEEEMFSVGVEKEPQLGGGASMRSALKPSPKPLDVDDKGKAEILPIDVSPALSSTEPQIKPAPVRSVELEEAADKLQDKIVCELPPRKPEMEPVLVTTIPPKTEVQKEEPRLPRKLPALKPMSGPGKVTKAAKTGKAQIFDLEEFLK